MQVCWGGGWGREGNRSHETVVNVTTAVITNTKNAGRPREKGNQPYHLHKNFTTNTTLVQQNHKHKKTGIKKDGTLTSQQRADNRCYGILRSKTSTSPSSPQTHQQHSIGSYRPYNQWLLLSLLYSTTPIISNLSTVTSSTGKSLPLAPLPMSFPLYISPPPLLPSLLSPPLYLPVRLPPSLAKQNTQQLDPPDNGFQSPTCPSFRGDGVHRRHSNRERQTTTPGHSCWCWCWCCPSLPECTWPRRCGHRSCRH